MDASNQNEPGQRQSLGERAPDTEPLERILWQGLQLDIPRSWEMVRYGLAYARGLCAFADPYRERLLFAWQRDCEQPEFGRLISDLAASARAAADDDDRASVAIETPDLPEGWHGLVIADGHETRTRAARYFEPQRILVEITIFWPDVRDTETEYRVFDGMDVAESGPWRSWRAFGIAADVPEALFLQDLRCLPADVTLTFGRHKRRHPRLTVRRMGFVDIWLKGPLEDWLAGQLKGWRIRSRETRPSSAGHAVCWMTASRHRPAPAGLLGLRLRRRDAAVLCPAEQRVYHVSIVDGRRSSRTPGLACSCGALLKPTDTGEGPA